ncbi:hypothetical protein HETIRDRAFT_174928 [Heterobasidion irregulare TC 32-1]|uniref:Uncharacterized protein n=1 Tax=Heterobasidion irregulare (strain TC 32-1) TaxID=747525 RepID=W4JTK3_HETIT|nr:uncharacterized protein HETIRDRAFT_174928 [Heterobasidion irregulare TC 32-1]ETW76887.1 hypothetical protein HETIRDRAFT_174928 [Heterobasidion irregulare TC 32-1]
MASPSHVHTINETKVNSPNSPLDPRKLLQSLANNDLAFSILPMCVIPQRALFEAKIENCAIHPEMRTSAGRSHECL